MNLQAEKLEVVKMIIETDDKDIIREVNHYLKIATKLIIKIIALRSSMKDLGTESVKLKSSIDGKTELKDAKTWLAELQD